MKSLLLLFGFALCSFTQTVQCDSGMHAEDTGEISCTQYPDPIGFVCFSVQSCVADIEHPSPKPKPPVLPKQYTPVFAFELGKPITIGGLQFTVREIVNGRALIQISPKPSTPAKKK